MLKIAVGILVLTLFISNAYATHISQPIIVGNNAIYYLGSEVEIEGYVEYQDNPTSNVLLDIFLINNMEKHLASIRSDDNGFFKFTFKPEEVGNYTIKIVSQCRDEHRNICTNRSTSIDIEVREAMVASDDRLEVRVLKMYNNNLDISITNKSDELITIDSTNFYITDNDDIYLADGDKLTIKPNDSIITTLTFENLSNEFELVYDDGISVIKVPEFPIVLLVLLFALSLPIYLARSRKIA
ncbi:MAG: hypothetical protein KatS3mg003_2196 [Candidatus Nitrosocaldaceae archaeon]|nr:MAG: hypothetical protein KatS3mg003_0010 [Candidatus Nitrosocaldaceae archaeon]GIU72717.1 MAG: hypothetical protein KatS3mg003_2196 [Candidatus Nitrosocaldaceae archaeon]